MQSTLELAEIRLSVALVTRNRPDSLERTLKSLRAQDVPPWEVIVSDDSDAEYAPETERIAAAHDCRYLTGPQRGLYANRNHAALACSGSHVRTMDDDHEFPAGHMAMCMNAITRDPRSIWIIGEYQIISTGDTVPANAAEKETPCPGQLNARGVSEHPPDPQNCWAFSDGASLIPKSVFVAGNRYADCYLFGASYLEFGSRLHWLGYRIRHLSPAYVIHHYNPSARSFMSRQIDVSSRIFALLCHSFVYQPTPRNKITALLTLAKHFILHGRIGRAGLREGWTGFRRHLETGLGGECA